MCEKKRFSSRPLAIQRLHEITTKGEKSDKIPVRAYYCRNCGGYHLTSAPLTKQQKREYKEGHQWHIVKIAKEWMTKNKWFTDDE